MTKISVMAFDKNTNAFVGTTIFTDSKEDFNEKFDEFCKDIPYSKYYTEIEPLDDSDEKVWEIIADHEFKI
jgi:hypothetical protein